jgi:glucarate dehydratase
MTHFAAALPRLDHSCDTPYPWNSADDMIVPGVLELRDGEVKAPTGPGLGVELDHGRLERLHRRYVDSGLRSRDDTGCMRRFRPDYELRLPRW